MFQSKIEIFIAKRAVILFAILEVAALLLVNDRLAACTGLIAGGLYSLARLKAMADSFSRLLLGKSGTKPAGGSIAGFVIAQAAAALLLILAVSIHFWAFIGTAAGILLVPAVVAANCITEGLHITRNNFE